MPETQHPWGGSRAIRVRITHPASGQSDQVYENVRVSPDGSIHLLSNRPPEEVFSLGALVGLREEFVPERMVTYIPPAERSITQTRADGLCIYCQLAFYRMLLSMRYIIQPYTI